MRAFIYCRVSTKEQGTQDHYSLDNQEQRCRDYLQQKKWRLVKVRKDVASGKSDAREGFQELLSDLHMGKIDVVLVYRLDRLSRNVRDIYDFLDTIQASGVAFVSVTEGFDTTTAMGRAMLGVGAVFAQLTREMISENTRDGLLRRAEAGLFNGNKRNVTGYDYARETGLVIHPEEARHVRQIFEWFTEHKWGIQKIARMLNLRGVPSKMGCQWAKGRIAAILRNPLYCGDMRVNGEVIPGRHEAIIGREQFAAAQAIIQSRTFLPPRSHQSQHLLSGIARCGVCGERLKAHYIQSTHRGKKHRYIFYHHSYNVKAGEGSCPGVSKSAPRLEAAIIEKIREMATAGWIEQVILEEVQSRVSTKRAPAIAERDQILLELAELGEKFSQWADRLDAGKIDEEQFEFQNQRLLARKQVLQQRLAALDQELRQEETLEVSLAEVRQVLQNFPTVWEALAHEERQETLRLLVEYLRVFKTHAELKLLFLDPVQIPLDFRKGARVAAAKAA